MIGVRPSEQPYREGRVAETPTQLKFKGPRHATAVRSLQQIIQFHILSFRVCSSWSQVFHTRSSLEARRNPGHVGQSRRSGAGPNLQQLETDQEYSQPTKLKRHDCEEQTVIGSSHLKNFFTIAKKFEGNIPGTQPDKCFSY